MTMKAVTLHQPHAALIAIGAKRIETRSWATQHRGPLAIHASKTNDTEALDRIVQAYVATLVDVIPMTSSWIAQQKPRETAFGFYEPGRFGWLLKDVLALTHPVLCRGWMKLWDLPEDVEAKVLEQLAEVSL